MTEFRLEVEPNEVRIIGRGAQALLAGFLTRAKFGEPYDPLTLLNGTLAGWLKALAAIQEAPPAPNARFGRDFIVGVAEALYRESGRLGWFRWTEEEQVLFLKETVAVPHFLSDEDIADIRELVDSKLYWARLIVDAADGKGPHA